MKLFDILFTNKLIFNKYLSNNNNYLLLFKIFILYLQKVIHKKMKGKSYKIRLIVLSTLAIVVYIYMIGSSFVKEIDDFYLGMELGKAKAKTKKMMNP